MNELSPEARALLESAREGAPPISKRSRATMRWALLSSMAPAVAAASFGKMLLVGVVSAAVGAGVTAVTIEANRSPDPARNTVQVSVPPMKPVVVASPEPVGSPPPIVEAVTPEPVAPQTPVVRAMPVRKPSAVSSPVEVVEPVVDDSMSAELEALAGIVAAVDAQRWGEADASLVAFHTRFTHPSLAIEASVLEVRILCGRGEAIEAAQRAEQLRAKYPRNPSVQRLSRSGCGPHPDPLP